MTRITKIRLKIDTVIKWLTPYLGLANAHMVNYIIDDNWTKFMPHAVRLEAERNGYRNTVQYFWLVREYLERNCDGSLDEMPGSDEFPELYKFVTKSWSHCIKVDEDICLSKSCFESRWNCVKQLYEVEEFMSPKKYHEVRAMSSSVAAIAQATKATHCVDVGGGKGYLSAALSMLYGMKVLSVDCNDTHVKGAEDRQAKFEKLWPSLLSKSGNSIRPGLVVKSYADNYKRTIDYIKDDTNLERLIVNNFKTSQADDDGVIKICLTGLHTCGDLAATSLRLFNSCDSVTSLMNVPCCYNLLTESVSGMSDIGLRFEDLSVGVTNDRSGFPLSNYLKAANFNLGRNARILTAQPIHKFTHSRNIPTRSIFFRALLQVILKDQYDIDIVPEGKLRGLAEKCPDFDSFVTQALQRFNFSPSPTNHNSKVEEYKEDLEKIEVYCAMRLCLAPVIEGLILLDRLLYLAECEKDSYLVKLFDPVVSPRHYALVALK